MRFAAAALVRSLALTIAIAAARAGHAQTVWTVDANNGPGADFTDIQPAVDVAVPGDRIEVRSGSYGTAVVEEGLTIMGTGPGVVMGNLRLRSVPAEAIVVVADLRCQRLELRDCVGPAIIDGVAIRYHADAEDCADVRLTRVRVESPAHGGAYSFEFEGVALGQVSHCVPHSVDGTLSLIARDSNLVLTACRFVGGEGKPVPDCFASWDSYGQNGVAAHGDSRVVVLDTTSEGGPPGFVCTGSAYWGGGYNAGPQATITVCRSTGNTIWYSSGTVAVDDSLPALELEGSFAPGGSVTLDVRAAADSTARLYAGREPARVDLPTLVPLLITQDRGISFGALPPSGTAELTFPIPALTRGTVLHAQATRTETMGNTELSNAQAIVVR